MKYLQIKDWDKFQQYKDRKPVWIKLYNDLLSDYEFSKLSDHERLCLVLLWLFASQVDNLIPYDSEWVSRKLPINKPVDLKVFVDKGWLVPVQNATQVGTNVRTQVGTNVRSPETYNKETETYSKEGEKEKERDTGGEKHPPVPTQKLIDLYHKTCSTLPKVVSVPLSKMSQASLRQRWREHPDLDWWGAYFSRIDHSAFLKGDNDKGWIADFQWIIKPSNMEKIVNGRYDRSRGKGRHAAPADRSDYAGL